MKTILRTTLILGIAALVAAGFWMLFNNTSAATLPGAGMGEHTERARPAGSLTVNETRLAGFAGEREGGENHSASLSRGLAEVGGAAVKLAGIVGVILLAQWTWNLGAERRGHPRKVVV